MKNKDKVFIIRKYIKADSALDAIKKDKNAPVDEVDIFGGWMNDGIPESLGFKKQKSD